jgi:hypothetical protein
MSSDFHEPQQQNFVSDMKQDGESLSYMSSDEIMAGSKEIMTHAQRQAFLKTSYAGKLFGVAHLLPEVEEVKAEISEDLPQLKRVRVSKLYTDNWTGNSNEENFIENPNWQQIETAIRDLDGNTKTLVSLKIDDETYMMIGGGNFGKYIVTATLDNEVFHSLSRQVYAISKSDVYHKKMNSSRKKEILLSSFYEALINANNNNVNFPNEQKLIVGGQGGNYSEKICVNLPQCLIAAITFAESGELEPLFTWKEDESLVTV